MGRRVKKISIFMGIIAALLVIMISGLVFYIQTPGAGRLLQSQINARIPGQVLFTDYRLNLFKGRIELGSILLKNPEGAVEVGVDQLALQFSWRGLFNKCITIEEIYLKAPNVRIFFDEHGGLGITRVFVEKKTTEKEPEKQTPGGRGPAFNFIVHSFFLENGSVVFSPPSKQTRATLNGIGIQCSGNVKERAWKIDLLTREAKYESQGMSVDVEALNVSGVMEKERLKELHVQIKTPQSRLSLKGTAQKIFSDPQLDLAIDLALDLPELKKTLSISPDLTGKVSGTLLARGAVKNPELILELAHSGGAVADFELEAIQLKATLKDKHLQIDPLEIMVASGGSIKAVGESDLTAVLPDGLPGASIDFDRLSYRLDLAINHLALNALLKDKFSGKGTLAGTVDLVGKGTRPQTAAAALNLQLTGNGITMNPDIEPIDILLTSKATLNQGTAILTPLSIRAGPTHINADGSYHVSSKHLNLRLAAGSQDLAKTLLPIGVKGVKGKVNIQANALGKIDRPAFTLAVDGTGMGVEKADIGDIGLMASLDESGLLEISRLMLSNQGSIIKGKGNARLFEPGAAGTPFTQKIATVNTELPIHLDLMLTDIDAADFFKTPPVSGLLSGSLVVGGGLKDLTADIDLEVKKLGSQMAQIGDVNILAQLAGGTLVFENLSIKNKNSAVHLSGSAGVFSPRTLQLIKDPPIALVVKADTIYLEDFIDQVKAKVSITADISGTAQTPLGEFNIHAEKIDLGVQKLEDLRLKGNIKDKRVNLASVSVFVSKDQALQGDGWISMDKSYTFRLSTQGISLDQIDKVQDKRRVKGVVVLDVAGKGSFDNPQLSGNAAIKDFSVNDKQLGDVNIRLDLSDNIAQLKGKLNFDLAADYHLKSREFSAALDFSDTDLAPYFAIAGATDFSGKITGKIQASGNAAGPSKIIGSGQFKGVDLFVKDQELAHAQNFNIVFKNQKIFIPGLALRLLKQGDLNIHGNADLNGPLAIKAEGNIPLDGLAMVQSNLPDITGTVTLSADVRGTVEKPEITSDIGLEKIGFTVPELMQKLHDLNGRVIVSSDALKIDKFNGKLDEGQFRLSGKFALKNMTPGQIKLDLAMQALPIKIPDTLDILVQSDLGLTGTLEDSTLKGDIVILEGIYHKDIKVNLLGGVGQKKRAQPVKIEKAPNPMLEKMKLNIAIKRRNPFWVDNNLAYLDIKPDLRISGTAHAPMIQGRTTIESGTITYQKKEFEVKKGVVDFLNPYELVPTLDIESTVQIRKWLITLAISGDPDNLIFTLSSDPPEEDGDIVSLIVLGKTSQELMGRSGGGQSAEQMLAEMVATTFGEDIKQMTGLDHFEVESASDAGSDHTSEGVKVTVGKNLSERLTVKYAADSRTGQMIQRAISEYKLMENIVVRGFQDSLGIFGGEIQYRLEFR